MENDKGQKVELYVPRKCSASNRLITAKDHASVQLSIPHVDAEGHLTNQSTTIAICGYLRGKGAGDAAINRLMQEGGFTTAFTEYDQQE
mmetsp:Transcript_141529/g.200439  ORF Transcript_141529/g.200439 Transcript_141529/m.200439 type:complete len:89 (+) Transcript_141529:33-299(+)